jgi:hypothetical protein
LQEQLARADALKAEGNAAFADGDMEQAIVSLKQTFLPEETNKNFSVDNFN